MDDLGQMVLAFLGIVVVLLLAYYSTRFMAKHYRTYNNGRNLQLLDRITLGKDKYIAVIEVKGQLLLVGVSDHNITLLTDLPELCTDDFAAAPTSDFSKILMQNIKQQLGITKDKHKEDQ